MAFFRQACAGRNNASAPIFLGADGDAWEKSQQNQRMVDACARAKIAPAIGFHILRHTWASLAVMNGMPLMVVAMNMGHVDTRMVEHHYGHLSPDFVAYAIRKGAPTFDIKVDRRVAMIA